MSEVAHQYQDEFKELKQEFLEVENGLPKTDTKHGPKGNWIEASVDVLTKLLDINKEQIRVVKSIVELREEQKVVNPDGLDVGHSDAIAQWRRTLGALKRDRHFMFETRNFKLVLAERARGDNPATNPADNPEYDNLKYDSKYDNPEYDNYDNPEDDNPKYGNPANNSEYDNPEYYNQEYGNPEYDRSKTSQW